MVKKFSKVGNLSLGQLITILIGMLGAGAIIALIYFGGIDLSKLGTSNGDIETTTIPYGVTCAIIEGWGSKCGSAAGESVGDISKPTVSGFPIPSECVNSKSQLVSSTCPSGTSEYIDPETGKVFIDISGNKMCICAGSK